MITLRHVNRIYPLKGGPFFALRDINLEIAEGEFISIMGPSGSGKSTLLHVLGLRDIAESQIPNSERYVQASENALRLLRPGARPHPRTPPHRPGQRVSGPLLRSVAASASEWRFASVPWFADPLAGARGYIQGR